MHLQPVWSAQSVLMSRFYGAYVDGAWHGKRRGSGGHAGSDATQRKPHF